MDIVSADFVRHNLRTLLNRVGKGETIAVARYNEPEAVIVSLDTWEKQQAELARLRRIMQSDSDFAGMKGADHVG